MVSHPSARELSGTSEPARDERLRRCTAERADPAIEDLQHVAGMLPTGGGGTEQTRVSCGALQRAGIFIVNLTDEQVTAPEIDLGRCGSRRP